MTARRPTEPDDIPDEIYLTEEEAAEFVAWFEFLVKLERMEAANESLQLRAQGYKLH